MSNVVSLASARAAADPLSPVEDAYARLARAKVVNVRPGQKQLSQHIHDALLADEPLVAEAPTGTGKTIAYLVGGLAASRHLGSTPPGEAWPVVVATATVGLQNQVISNDLPKLFEAGLLAPDDAIIAKGRQRYYCVLAGERLLAGDLEDVQYDIFDKDANIEVDGLDEMRGMHQAFMDRQWRGDIDSYATTQPIFWGKVQASSDTCIGRRCDHFQHCPYFDDRKRLAKAKVVVANHDLVLSDLTAQLADQEPVFPFSRYLLLVDEAHHLPNKAMEAGAAQVDLQHTLGLLAGMATVTKKLFGTGVLAKFFESKDLGPESFATGYLERALQAAISAIKAIEVDPTSGNRRFSGGIIPGNLEGPCQEVFRSVDLLRDTLGKAINALKNASSINEDPKQKPFVAEALYESAMMLGTLTRLWKAVQSFTSDKEAVRWVFHQDLNHSLCVSPIEGDVLLRNLMWDNPRVRVAMVSATVQDLDGFTRFKGRCGLPETTQTHAMESSFPYHENQIWLEQMRYSPRMADREGYEAELKHKLPQIIQPDEGTLVICTSRRMLDSLVPVLRGAFGARVRAQGEKGLKQLVDEHRQAIDRGQGSILVGLATVAEGLDLPGAYCTHVVITALPFSVPTNPVEEERAERLGAAYFAKHALPDAFVKLVQMVGRLMRRETDRGSITVMDNRLHQTRFGQEMLKALPPFRKKFAQRAKAARKV